MGDGCLSPTNHFPLPTPNTINEACTSIGVAKYDSLLFRHVKKKKNSVRRAYGVQVGNSC